MRSQRVYAGVVHLHSFSKPLKTTRQSFALNFYFNGDSLCHGAIDCIALITLSLVRAAEDHNRSPNLTTRASSSSEHRQEALIDWSSVQEVPSTLPSAPTTSKAVKSGFLNQRKLTDEQLRAKNRQDYLKVKSDPKKLAIELERNGMRYHRKKVEKMAKEKKWTKEEMNAELERRVKERKERKQSRDKRKQLITKTEQGH